MGGAVRQMFSCRQLKHFITESHKKFQKGCVNSSLTKGFKSRLITKRQIFSSGKALSKHMFN